MRPRLRTATLCALLFAGTLLLFSRATGFGFVNLDDPSYVTENPVVQRGLSWAGLVWAFTAPTDYWQPLAWLSHMLDCQVYGLAAAGHHFTSALWHALNAVLAFFLFRRLLGGWGRSAFAAALFAWHPLRVESVVWITERKDVMSGCFFLLTVLAYLRFATARDAGRPARIAYLLALASFAAGLTSKPMLVTLPLVLLLLDYWPLRRSQPAWRLAAEKLPFFGLAGAVGVATVLMQRHAGAFSLAVPLAARLANAAVSLVRYLGKFFWPFNLIACYEHPGSWPSAAILAALAVLLVLGVVAWGQRRDRPWIVIGVAWFLITLLPVIGLLQVGFQAMADRYTYLPLLGFELALVGSLPATTTRRGRIAAAAAGAIVLGALAWRTWNQEGVWRNSETLFTHAVRVDGRNDVAESFLATAFFAAGRFDEAGIHAERALALNPHNDQALVALAWVDEHAGRVDKAMALYQAVLAIRPDNSLVQCELGLLAASRGQTARARSLMLPALRAAPNLRGRTLQMGRAALARGDAKGALFLADLVLAVAPDDATANAEAGLALVAAHAGAAAIAPLQKAAGEKGAPPAVLLALAQCEEEGGQRAAAVAALARTEAAAPNDPAALSQAADLYALQGDFDAAIRVYRRVIAIAPADSRAHAALGYLLIHGRDRDGGMAQWRRALELEPDFPRLREQLRRFQQ